MSFLRINRFGRVETKVSSNNQCKDVGHQLYDYQVSICCPDTNTDENEFIIDHLAIHKAVNKFLVNKMSSCEGICKGLSVYLKKIMAKHKIHMTDMYIKIMPVLSIDGNAPLNRAYMEYSESGMFV